MVIEFSVPERLVEKVSKMSPLEISALVTRALDEDFSSKELGAMKQMSLDSLLYMSKLESMIGELTSKVENGVVLSNSQSNTSNSIIPKERELPAIPEFDEDEEFTFSMNFDSDEEDDDNNDQGMLFKTIFK